jgi:hypothetical protein
LEDTDYYNPCKITIKAILNNGGEKQKHVSNNITRVILHTCTNKMVRLEQEKNMTSSTTSPNIQVFKKKVQRGKQCFGQIISGFIEK